MCCRRECVWMPLAMFMAERSNPSSPASAKDRGAGGNAHLRARLKVATRRVIADAVNEAQEGLRSSLPPIAAAADQSQGVPVEPVVQPVRLTCEVKLAGRKRMPRLVFKFYPWRFLALFLMILPFYMFLWHTRPYNLLQAKVSSQARVAKVETGILEPSRPYKLLHAKLSSQARVSMLETGIWNQTTRTDWDVIFRSGWMFWKHERRFQRAARLIESKWNLSFSTLV